MIVIDSTSQTEEDHQRQGPQIQQQQEEQQLGLQIRQQQEGRQQGLQTQQQQEEQQLGLQTQQQGFFEESVENLWEDDFTAKGMFFQYS
jgi:hypothetical protein